MNERTFQTKVNDENIGCSPISSRVPQGSVLDPIPYVLYTPKLPLEQDTATGIFAADIAILSYHHMLWFHTKSSKWPPTVAKGVESKSLHLHSGRSILWGHNKKCTDTTNTKCKISRVTHRQQTDVENGYHKEEKTNRNQD